MEVFGELLVEAFLIFIKLGKIQQVVPAWVSGYVLSVVVIPDADHVATSFAEDMVVCKCQISHRVPVVIFLFHLGGDWITNLPLAVDIDLVFKHQAQVSAECGLLISSETNVPFERVQVLVRVFIISPLLILLESIPVSSSSIKFDQRFSHWQLDISFSNDSFYLL